MNYLILDTETANGLDCPLVYDIGWIVFDEEGTILEMRSYVVADIFLNKEMMTSAYYEDKIEQYITDIDNGERVMRKFSSIKRELTKTMNKYNIEAVIAHNVRFDYRSCQTTQRYLTKSKQRFFFPYDTHFIDTLEMAKTTYRYNEDYNAFCQQNGYCYGKNNDIPRFTAEILTRYFTGNNNFKECHTGLEDCIIEMEIFFRCLRAGTKPHYLWGKIPTATEEG